MNKVAIYARVSADRHQTVENQFRQLQEVGERLGWIVVAVHTDQGISGVSPAGSSTWRRRGQWVDWAATFRTS